MLKIRCVDSFEDFLNLENVWTETLQRSGNNNIFSTWEWLSSWWRYFGKNKQRLLILLAEDEGKLIGIAPLMLSVESLFGLKLKKIQFIGADISDYCDFILAAKPQECLTEFLKVLSKIDAKWDLMQLANINNTSLTLRLIGKISSDLRIVSISAISECPYIVLPSSYTDFENSLNAKRRKNLRRSLRQLNDNFTVEFAHAFDLEILETNMNTFFDLHQKRFISKGLPGKFSKEQTRSFHLDIARFFFKKGWLGLSILKLSNIPVAALYGFHYGSKYFYYLSGWDPAYSKYGISNLIIANTIAKSIEKGLKEFDFLRGAEEYKNWWNVKSHYNHQIILVRKGVLISFQRKVYSIYWKAGNSLKFLFRKYDLIGGH